jgi:hypothetical protein
MAATIINSNRETPRAIWASAIENVEPKRKRAKKKKRKSSSSFTR